MGSPGKRRFDAEWSVTHFTEKPDQGKKDFPPYAFRYIYVSDPGVEIRRI